MSSRIGSGLVLSLGALRMTVGACLLTLLAPASMAQSTAFTYQGSLKDDGQLANGLHDFRFSLFDASSGGNQVGSTQCVNNLLVADGLFTATIDFGAQFATIAPRFLQISVRVDTGLDCTSAVGFTTLAQRQAITPAPRATHANSAFSLDAPDGSPAKAVFVDNAGNVGIGTTSPGVPLHVSSDLVPVIVIQDPGPPSSQAGYVGFWNNTGAETGFIGFGSPLSPTFFIVNSRSAGNIELFPGAGGATIARGDIKLGDNSELFAPGSVVNLRIVSGRVPQSGGDGPGYSAVRLNDGFYRVDFTTPFADLPVLTAMPYYAPVSDPLKRTATIGTRATTYVEVHIFQLSGANADGAFHFTAVGPR